MLRYTGHPFIDIGMETIVAMAHKQKPEELSEADLERAAIYLEERLIRGGKVATYLMSNYTNAKPLNSSLRDKATKRIKSESMPEVQAYIDSVLWSFRTSHPKLEEACIFCGRQAVTRAARTQIPLMNGENIFNFSPRGVPGYPVCGHCLLAVHAYALGSIRSQGRALSIYTPQPEAILFFARRALEHNRKLFQMFDIGEVSEDDWKEGGQKYARTRLIEALLEFQQQRTRRRFTSVTAYHVTNFGPKADVAIYQIPATVLDFLAELVHGDNRSQAWHYYVRRSWYVPKKWEGDIDTADKTEWRNDLYESLLELPMQAGRFIQMYLSPSAKRLEEWIFLPDGNWELIELFLRKVVIMKHERIEAIKQLGDRLTEYIQHRDRRLFNKLHFARNYADVRMELVRTARDGWSPDEMPLLPTNTFITIFEEGDNDFADLDWRLARDILMIRICEQLKVAGWFERNPDIADIEQESES